MSELEKVDRLIEKELHEDVQVRVSGNDEEDPVGGGLSDEFGDGEEHNPLSLELNMRQTLDGNYVIRDHIDIDILVKPDDQKIVLMPKEEQFDSEIVQNTQSSLMDFLRKKGIIKYDSVEGGNAFFTLQASYPSAVEGDINPLQAVIFSIGKFIEKEKPYMEFDEKYFDKMLDRMTNPPDEETTDLGEVPHGGDKGDQDQTTYPASHTYSQWY